MNGWMGGIKVGQRVRYRAYAGMGRNGPEYREATGKVVIRNRDSLVLNAGGRHGHPVVVTEANFVAAR